jgi:hypothetical protein
MSVIASATTATVLALGIAVVLDAHPGQEPTITQVRQPGSPGAAQVEIAERHTTPQVSQHTVATGGTDRCRGTAADPDLEVIGAATRGLSAWPEMSDVLSPVGQPDPPRAADLVILSLGPTSSCNR